MVDCAEFARVAPWLAEALAAAGGTHTLADVFDLLVAGDAKLWATPRAAVVTQVVVYPRKRVLDVWLAGSAVGGLTDILALLPEAEAWARERGISDVIATGRLGWGKVLQHLGFKSQALVVSKALH